MHIQILGAGCSKCERLARNAEAAARMLGPDFTFEKIADIARIVEFDIVQTPALLVDGRVLSSGSVPGIDEIRGLLLESKETGKLS